MLLVQEALKEEKEAHTWEQGIVTAEFSQEHREAENLLILYSRLYLWFYFILQAVENLRNWKQEFGKIRNTWTKDFFCKWRTKKYSNVKKKKKFLLYHLPNSVQNISTQGRVCYQEQSITINTLQITRQSRQKVVLLPIPISMQVRIMVMVIEIFEIIQCIHQETSNLATVILYIPYHPMQDFIVWNFKNLKMGVDVSWILFCFSFLCCLFDI